MKEETGNPNQDESFGSDDTFFDDLEKAVNSQIIDEENTAEATPQENSGPIEETHIENQEGSDNWKKRYSDSSREALIMKRQLDELKPFVPVLEAMKKDSGLVDHVRGYFREGGKPAKSVQEQLGLDEDFVFDMSEAVSDTNSDSAKVMNAHINGLVQNRVAGMMNAERKKSFAMSKAAKRKQDEASFKKNNNMTDEEFAEFTERAKKHTMSLDDVNYLLNRDKAAGNVAQSTKADMLSQMKNVRNMPQTAGGLNNAGEVKSPDGKLFDALLGIDGELESMFSE